jgi:hypothetical protein
MPYAAAVAATTAFTALQPARPAYTRVYAAVLVNGLPCNLLFDPHRFCCGLPTSA